ncbi:MAG: selenide, water dikinase SelD, partial [Planctomycetota bacterium]
GMPAADDAGIYRIDEKTFLVQTVDLMTPVVDDAELFGRICAANCLSDIYATGAEPKTALSVLAFPSETMNPQVMYLMMKGAMDVLAEAGVALLGGHSIKDEQIKLGFAITGLIDSDSGFSHELACPGDRIVLTKPLGCGTLNFARQIGRDVDLRAMQESMAMLNRDAAAAARAVGVTAATDVTGFGLFGHLIRMARHSKVTAEIRAEALPAFDGVLELLAEEVIPGAIERNREFAAGDVQTADRVDPARELLGYDAQTSGGLLLAVAEDRHQALLSELKARGAGAWTIGRFTGPSDGQIELVSAADATETDPTTQERQSAMVQQNPQPSPDESHGPGCCSDVFGGGQPPQQAGASNASQTSQAFGQFMSAASAGGAVDAVSKELVAFALVVQSRCEPCVQAHLEKARSMGISRQQLDEVAWQAAAMGGAPVRMFYLEMMQKYPAGH